MIAVSVCIDEILYMYGRKIISDHGMIETDFDNPDVQSSAKPVTIRSMKVLFSHPLPCRGGRFCCFFFSTRSYKKQYKMYTFIRLLNCYRIRGTS